MLDKRRLYTLETHAGRRDWTARDHDWYGYLSGSSLRWVIEDWSEGKAERRWLHVNDRVAGRPGPGGFGWVTTTGDGWHWETDEAERVELAAAERRELESLLTLYPLHAALAIWANEPDDEGWPVLHGSPDRYATFIARLHRERQRMASHRRADNRVARQWRQDHADWSEDMDPGDADAFDLALIAEQE
jgi:hypothetical protein